MRSACPQQIVSCRYVITFCVLCVFGILPQWAGAQPQSASQSAAAYVQPPKGASLIRLNHVVGQVVIERVPKNWFGAAQRLQIALFDTTHVLIATVLSDDEGQFEIEGIVPGAYTLAAGADSLHLLSIPLLVGPGPLDHAPLEHGLLLIMRANTDRRMSAASAITNQTLRAELLEMVKKDQDIRREWIRQGVDHPDKEVQARMEAIDAHNLARLKELVLLFGWPGPALAGVDGTEAAFLLVQHGRFPFQKEMLPRIRTAYRSGKLPGQDYALLLDRVLVNEGRPQVYGTQAKSFAEWKNREPTLLPIEDETHVDRRRAKVGLFPLAEYLKLLKEAYYPPEKNKP